MNLNIQIYSLLFSFFFGIIFSICTNLNYRFLFSKKLFFKIIFTFIYIVDFSFVYFFILEKINNGVIHNYFLLFIIIGYLIGYYKFNGVINRFKLYLKKCVKKVSSRKKKV